MRKSFPINWKRILGENGVAVEYPRPSSWIPRI